jgi:hypothetical protein
MPVTSSNCQPFAGGDTQSQRRAFISTSLCGALCGTELTLSRLPRARRSRTADIGAIYGSIGEGAIEVHHLPPLGDGKGK